jgi:PAS domain S-box-containing protein
MPRGTHWARLVYPLPDEAPAAPQGRLQRALAAAGAVAWEWNLAERDNVTGINERFCAGASDLLGLKHGSGADSFELVHSEDRTELRVGMAEAVRGERPYDFEFRLLAADGRIEWVRDRAELLRDSDGRPVLLSGLAQRITEQKNAEAARAETEAQLRATFDQAPIGIAHVGLDGTLLRVNDTLCRFLAHGRTALLGLSFDHVTHPDDLERNLAQTRALLAGHATRFALETRYIRADSSTLWSNLTVSLVHNDSGAPSYFIAFIEDISARRSAEAALAGREALVASLIADAPAGVAVLDRDLRYIAASRRFMAAHRVSGQPADLIGRCHYEVFPEIPERWKAIHRRCLDGASERSDSDIFPRSDGSADWLRWEIEPWRDRSGAIGGIILCVETITADVEARILLQSQSDVLRAIIDGCSLTNILGAVCRAAQSLLPGASCAVLVREGPDHILRIGAAPDLPPFHCTAIEAPATGTDPGGCCCREAAWSRQPVIVPDIGGDPKRQAACAGTLKHGLRACWSVPLLLDDEVLGTFVAYYGQVRAPAAGELERIAALGGLAALAIQRTRTADRAARIEARFRATFEQAAVGIAHLATDGAFLRVNDRLCAITGYSRTELLALAFQDITHPDDLPTDLAQMGALARDEISTYTLRKRYVRKNGCPIWVNLTVSLVHDAASAADYFIGVIEDIDEHVRAEDALRESEARFRTLAEALPLFVWSTTPDGEAEFQNRRFKDYTGLLSGPSVAQWAELLHPDDRARAVMAWRRSLETGTVFEVEYRLRGADGRYRWLLARALPQRASPEPGFPDGRITRWLGTCTDIDDLVRTREMLARSRDELERRVAERTVSLAETARELADEIRRREEAQATLLQTQKLEALGQLTGGLAHDFNNVLAAILGSLDLIERRSEDPKLIGFIGNARRASDRATRLVRQMLSFARKSELQPAVLDPAALLVSAQELVAAAVGASVECAVAVEPGTWPVIADRGQLEVALLNLAVNARDAMPDGGRIAITARNLPAESVPEGLGAGDYIGIAVRDTGAGMSPEVLAKAAEPFFTTKPAGQGTGLGLAMVHRFATGSEGALRIDSLPGQGTVVEMILPRANVRAAPEPAPGGPAPARHEGGTILLVDDDAHLRPVMAASLRDLGYAVVEARSAEAAFAAAQTLPRLDLLVTDVAMPGRGGAALAAQLRAERTSLSVLFVTGNADPDLPGESVLRKPFGSNDLAAAVLAEFSQRQHSKEAALAHAIFQRIRTAAMRRLYETWLTTRAEQRLPRLERLPQVSEEIAAVSFLAEVNHTAPTVSFRFVSVGASLIARLGHGLNGVEADDTSQDAIGSLQNAYSHATGTGLPSYEFVRFSLGDGPADTFERLILPFSEDGHRPTHLFGMVLFQDGADDAHVERHAGDRTP